MCVTNSFFTRLRSVSLLQGRKDDRCVYTLERSWPPCSRHCSSILDKDTVRHQSRTMSNITIITLSQLMCETVHITQKRFPSSRSFVHPSSNRFSKWPQERPCAQNRQVSAMYASLTITATCVGWLMWSTSYSGHMQSIFHDDSFVRLWKICTNICIKQQFWISISCLSDDPQSNLRSQDIWIWADLTWSNFCRSLQFTHVHKNAHDSDQW